MSVGPPGSGLAGGRHRAGGAAKKRSLVSEDMDANPNPTQPPFGEHLVIAAKLRPPRPRLGSIGRPRLARKLLESSRYRLTVVRADAGYGKTTALTQLASLVGESRWYGLDGADRDPLIFLRHLIALFEGEGPDDRRQVRSLDILSRQPGASTEWVRAVDALANDLHETMVGDHVLILDDFHLAESPAVLTIVERLLAHGPSSLHLVLGTRQVPGLSRMARRVASGDVLRIGRSDLAFAEDEVVELFRAQSQLELDPEPAERLVSQTDGWPIAVHLMAQVSATELSSGPPRERDAMFEYLANEVFDEQSPELKEFLLGVSVLRRLDAELCDDLLDRDDSALRLDEIERSSLFVSALGGGTWRLHPLFREFLSRKDRGNDPAGRRARNGRACLLLRERGSVEEAIYHALQAGDSAGAGDLLEEVAGELVDDGLYETLGAWAEELPADVLDRRPELLRACGDAARLTSRFEEATASYARAGRLFAARGERQGECRALEGEALVHLDTVRPAHAGPLLRRALKLVGEDRERRARLLHLLAENSANHGDLRRAERIELVASKLDADTSARADPRIHVRRGRLAQARALAERELRREDRASGPGLPRSHRESTAVLAWIAALSGEAEEARTYADRALARGRELHSPIVEALALCRMGHGWLTGPSRNPGRALDCYRQSLAVSERIGVDRFRAEALLGQVIAEGEAGAIDSARAAAREALEILDAAGDRYLAAVVWLALGAVGVGAGHPEAPEWLDRGGELAAGAGDSYGLCVADLWRAVRALEDEDWPAFDPAARALLTRAEEQGHSCVLVAHPFLGSKDPGMLSRLLLTAVERDVEAPVAERYLGQLTAHDAGALAERAPFRASLLGPFELWEGDRQVPAEAWSRDKALALFQYLALHRGRAIHREHVREALWPGARPDSSALGLRVALSALNKAVEPDRDPDAPPRLVRREGASLRIDAELLHLDLDDFRAAAEKARQLEAEGADRERVLQALRHAISTYRGDLLEDRPYEDWVEDERRAVRDTYLRAATRAADLMVRGECFDEAIEVSEAMLACDPTWETAYRQQMEAHAAAGNRALALRCYERCAAAMRHHLGAEPSEETLGLRDRLIATES